MSDHGRMRVCVIGAGVVGCSVGLELRRRGCEVTVVDRNGDVGHGSTSASCGIVRRFYSQPGMIAMAHEAAWIWADWASYLGPIDDDLAVFRRPGMLFIPPRVDEGIRGIVAEMKRVGIRVSLLSSDEVASRFSFLDTASQFPPKPVDHPDFFEPTDERIEGAIFEEDAGYVVSPGLATQNLRRAAERAGVRFLLNREVTKIRRQERDGFRLEFEDGSLDSGVVINVAGPHSARVNRLAGVELPLETRPLRREVHALANPLFTEGADGGVPIVGDLDGGIYFRPESGGRDLIVGTTDPECDPPEWLDDPDDYEQGVTDTYRQRQCLRLMKRFPRVRLGPARGLAALYDVTLRDWYPIVDRTDLAGYYVCIGTSGSSFKTAPVLGRLMAEIVDGCESGHDTDLEPIRLQLPRAGLSVDTRFLSRLRGEIRTTGTVIG
jgi:sarcosine oxidase subunit beta